MIWPCLFLPCLSGLRTGVRLESQWSPEESNLLRYQMDSRHNSTEKAGVGGSIPSLATMSIKGLREILALP